MLKAIIVDDEAPARSELRFLLGELNQAEVVSEAASVREAIEKLKEYPCDVMFLDINMPEATGLQLAEALQHLKFPPAVVFVTAYSEFALDAFKVNAVDYLVKPVETERLAHALARVREHVVLHARAQKAERIPVEKGGKKILINIDQIRFVMARDDYAYLQTDTDRYFSTVSLAQLEKTLDGHGFFRVHRGYLVNLSLVKEVEPQSGGTLLLTLDGVEEKIPVSRRRVSSLKKALGLYRSRKAHRFSTRHQTPSSIEGVLSWTRLPRKRIKDLARAFIGGLGIQAFPVDPMKERAFLTEPYIFFHSFRFSEVNR